MTQKKTSADLFTFRVTICADGANRVRTLTVTERHRMHVPTKLRSCEKEAERDVLKVAQHWGIDYAFEPRRDAASVRLEWLEHLVDGEWVACPPDVDPGNRYEEIARGLQLARRVGLQIKRRTPTDETFANPNVVISALRRSSKFIEVERFEVEHNSYWIEAIPSLADGAAA